MKKGSFNIVMDNGEYETVTGYISTSGIFGIDHRNKRWWIITHLQTGLKVGMGLHRLARAQRIITQLEKKPQLWSGKKVAEYKLHRAYLQAWDDAA